MVNTRAAEALRWAVDPANPARKWSQSDLARELGIAQPSVSAWVHMSTRPEAHFRQALERLLDIPANEWMTDEERAVADGQIAPPRRSRAVRTVRTLKSSRSRSQR